MFNIGQREYDEAMVKINIGTYSYYGSFLPRQGDVLNFGFTSPPIAGTVILVEWVHTNEVNLTVK